jgi:purine-cytosine permease-like protein
MRYYSSYDISRDSMYEFYESLNLAELKTENQKSDFNSFLYVLGEFSVTRQNLEYLTKKSLLWALKFTNYILAIILIFLLFLNRGSTFSNALFMVLSTVIVFILLIIEDYESLRIGGYTYNAVNSEQLFDLLGVRRYYPSSVLGRVILDPGKIYRIGVYDKSSGKDKIIDMRYSPTRGLMKYSPLKTLKKLKPSKKFFKFRK